MPTRWVKFIVAIFLCPICAILTQTFFTAFARATVTQRLWAGEEFWFFSLGVVLWLIAFFGLPRPVLVYVFGHELTHALWVWLMGGRVSQFRVGRDGGHIVTNEKNFWIALAPYFFPLYSMLAIAVYGSLSLVLNVAAIRPAALRRHRRHLGVSSHLHLLDDSEEPDGSERSRHIFFARLHLSDESDAAQRDAGSRLAADHFRRFGADLSTNLRSFSMGRRLLNVRAAIHGRWHRRGSAFGQPRRCKASVELHYDMTAFCGAVTRPAAT